MERISFKLEVFEGPLELLLHLISKHKLNIYDIEITLLLEQYLEYIDKMSETDMEIASEFLEMAARLIYIKTVSLLPKYDEADDLKQELTGELIEYAVCKKIAERLRNDFIGYDIFVREQMHIVIDGKYKRIHSSNELIDAFLAAAGRKRRNMPLEAEIFHPIVSREFVSVTSKIIYVLRHMYKSGSITMDKLFDGLENRSECVATFLAILELSKTGRIYISDDNKRIDFCGRSKQQRHNEVVT